VLSIKNPGGRTIALAAFLAVHPTAMSHETEVYDGDLFGVAAIQTEQMIGGPAIVALFNGAEGDISPQWDVQDRAITMELGSRVSHAILLANASAKAISGEMAQDYRVIQLADRCFQDINGVKRHTDSRSVPGKGELGGAEDGRTFLYDLGFKEGVTGPRTMFQGDKYAAFDFKGPVQIRLTPLIELFLHAPKMVPVSTLAVGPYVIATVPFEPTLVTGRRIAQVVAERKGTDRDHVLLIGLANEYVSYLATAEEYDAQDYEGASTLYGPASQALIERELADSAVGLAKPSGCNRPHKFHYSPGEGRSFGVHQIGAPPFNWDDGLANVLQGSDRLPLRAIDVQKGSQIIPQGFCPGYSWTESTAPSLKRGEQMPNRVLPSVSIEIDPEKNGRWQPLRGPGGAEDDRGLNTVTILRRACRGSLDWCCFWIPPSWVPASASYRFRVDPVLGAGKISEPFSLAAARD
jgi:neutral ceramidase